MWDPIAYALGFIDCDNISARCMLTIFAFFATKTEASVLRMLNGSPDMRLNGPIADYIKSKGGRYDLYSKSNFDYYFVIVLRISLSLLTVVFTVFELSLL